MKVSFASSPTLQQRRQTAFNHLLASYHFGEDVEINGMNFDLRRDHHEWSALLSATTPQGPRAILFTVIFRRKLAHPSWVNAADADTHQPVGHPG